MKSLVEIRYNFSLLMDPETRTVIPTAEIVVITAGKKYVHLGERNIGSEFEIESLRFLTNLESIKNMIESLETIEAVLEDWDGVAKDIVTQPKPPEPPND